MPDERLIPGRAGRRRGVTFGREPLTRPIRRHFPAGVGIRQRAHRKGELRDIHKRALAYLIEHPGSDKPSIAQALSIEWTTAEHVLRELERMKFIERVHGYPTTWRPV